MGEQIKQIELNKLQPFKNHPFQVNEDEALLELVGSILENGVLSPALARPCKGGYELISGHRRHAASQLAGLDTMPVIIRDLKDNEAVIIMVDSNKQRENILPSEKAFAYKMKLDAIKRQGRRTDLSSPQPAAKSRSDDVIAQDEGLSGDITTFATLLPRI